MVKVCGRWTFKYTCCKCQYVFLAHIYNLSVCDDDATLAATLCGCHPHLQRALVKSLPPDSGSEARWQFHPKSQNMYDEYHIYLFIYIIYVLMKRVVSFIWNSKSFAMLSGLFILVVRAFRFSMRAGDRHDWLTSCCSSLSVSFLLVSAAWPTSGETLLLTSEHRLTDWRVYLSCVSLSNNATAPWARDALQVALEDCCHSDVAEAK